MICLGIAGIEIINMFGGMVFLNVKLPRGDQVMARYTIQESEALFNDMSNIDWTLLTKRRERHD